MTINRDYLYYLFKEIEKSNYERGYSDGYSDRGKVENDEHPINDDFKDFDFKKHGW